MILEGLVSTISPDGGFHLAPMGPHVDPPTPGAELTHFLLRPFRTSQTYANLRAHGEGVLHVTDDVLLLARAAIGAMELQPALKPASQVRGWVLADCCRYHEFRITACDNRDERVRLEAAVVHTGRVRDFFGFNRAKHAVVEAAILATRVGIVPAEQKTEEFRRLAVLVEKTGGPQERESFAVLEGYVRKLRT